MIKWEINIDEWSVESLRKSFNKDQGVRIVGNTKRLTNDKVIDIQWVYLVTTQDDVSFYLIVHKGLTNDSVISK